MENKSSAGFTLLEVIIVMFILTIMLGGAMYIILSGQDTFDEGSMTSFLESQASRLMDVLKDDISEGLIITASVPAIANSYASLTLQVPVLVGGSYWNPVTGAVNWGAEGNQDWYITYAFSYVRTISEAADGLDYNRDGDISDSFDIGDLVKEIYNPGGVLQQSVKLCSDIMTVAGTRYADINNDGNQDRIFTYCNKNGQPVSSGGIGVIVNIWLGGKLGGKRNPIIVNTNMAMMLMNPQ
jgi:prepilin-type N-terminal cleavage/methylation domain-containing protein